jgi:Rod binding domain-containing protein
MTIPPTLASTLGQAPLLPLAPSAKRAPASTPNSTPATLKLRKAAAEFESLLISSLLKSMKSTFADSEDDQSTDPAHDTLEDFGTRAMATAIANAGGLGVGSLILKHLEPALANSQNGNQPPHRKDSGPPADILIEQR